MTKNHWILLFIIIIIPIQIIRGRTIDPSSSSSSSFPVWQQFHNSFNHTGWSLFTGPRSSTVRVRWSYQGGDNFISSPAIDNQGNIYVCNNDGNLYSFYPNGTVKFIFRTSVWDASSPVLSDNGDTVYMNDGGSTLWAVDTSTGQQLWNFSQRISSSSSSSSSSIDPTYTSPLSTSPYLSSDGTIYTFLFNGFYALNATNGQLLWSRTDIVSSAPAPAAVAYNNLVYIPGMNSVTTLYALNITDGATVWSVNIGGFSFPSSPTINPVYGTVLLVYYINFQYVNITAFSLDNGQVEWTLTQSGTASIATPAVDKDGTVIVSFGNNVFVLQGNTGYSLGSVPIAGVLPGPPQSSPAIDATGTVFIGSGNSIIAIDRYQSMKQLWSFTTGDIVLCSPVINNNGLVLIGSNDHTLYALEAE